MQKHFAHPHSPCQYQSGMNSNGNEFGLCCPGFPIRLPKHTRSGEQYHLPISQRLLKSLKCSLTDLAYGKKALASPVHTSPSRFQMKKKKKQIKNWLQLGKVSRFQELSSPSCWPLWSEIQEGTETWIHLKNLTSGLKLKVYSKGAQQVPKQRQHCGLKPLQPVWNKSILLKYDFSQLFPVKQKCTIKSSKFWR